MQAQNRVKVIPGQALALGFALMTALVAGGVGGYEMRGVSLGLPGAGARQAQPAANYSAELARHSASERVDAFGLGGYDKSGELARHSASERADIFNGRLPFAAEVAAHGAEERADFAR
jgi:hypothetical protein